jgi:sulfur carrier protein
VIIYVNGEERELPDGATLRVLVEHLGLAEKACAAEVNQQLVPRSNHGNCVLAPSDRVEIVTLVGGG